MGGYAVKVKEQDNAEFPHFRAKLYSWQVRNLVEAGLLELPPEDDIKDKSKCDWVSKSVTLLQVTWFVAQLIARTCQKLPVTTLELFTAGIVVCTLATYIAWWNKPSNVKCPHTFEAEMSISQLQQHGIYGYPGYQSLLISLHWEGRTDWKQGGLFSAIVCLVAVLPFAACHLVAWNFEFSTWTERLLWRIASVSCAGLPIVSLVMGLHSNLTPLRWNGHYWVQLAALFPLGLYILVRTYLLVEIFVGLRSVPADVYRNVNWSTYIPHI
jgi:hypothetical protein